MTIENPTYQEMQTRRIIEHGLSGLGANNILLLVTKGKLYESPHIVGSNDNLIVIEVVEREFVGFDSSTAEPDYAPVVSRYVVPVASIEYIKLRREVGQ